MLDAGVPPGLLDYWKAGYLADLSDGAIDAIVAHAWSTRSLLSNTVLGHMGGASSRVRVDETSFGDRYGKYAITINAVWTDQLEFDEHTRWAREFFASTEPFSTGWVYVTFWVTRVRNES